MRAGAVIRSNTVYLSLAVINYASFKYDAYTLNVQIHNVFKNELKQNKCNIIFWSVLLTKLKDEQVLFFTSAGWSLTWN